MPRDPATHVGAVVMIDGVEVPCDPASSDPGVLSGLRVTWGRTHRLEKPGASTCDFEMIDPDGGKTDHGAVIGYASKVEVLAVAPSGARQRVFYGVVTDLSLSHEDGPDARLTVTCADPTVALADVMVGDTPWPAQTPAQRRSAIMATVPAGTISWYAMPSYTPTVTMAAQDVDNQSLWDMVTDFLWSLGIVPWPVAHDGDNIPGVVMTGGKDPDLAYGVIDTRANRRISLGDFTTGNYTTPKAIRTVVVDACDVDLDGTTFAANPADILQTIRITWGDEDSEQKHIVRQGGGGGTADNPAGQVFDTTARVTKNPGNIVPLWQYQMADWGTHFSAPWAADTIKIDADRVTGMDDFHRALLRLLSHTSRMAANIVLQNLPSWTPWRRWVTRVHHPNVAGTVQGGTYSFEDGRWVLELKATVDRALEGNLAPLPTVVVAPGDVVDVPHTGTDALAVVADPATMWAVGDVATFTDGAWGWDGGKWVAGGVQAILVGPGSVQTVRHDDPRVRANPATAWARDAYATFTESGKRQPYRWDGTAWLAYVAPIDVAPGDVVDVPHDAPGVTPLPADAWPAGAWATFTDGPYRWDGTAWQPLSWATLPADMAWQDVPAGVAWTDNPLTEGA